MGRAELLGAAMIVIAALLGAGLALALLQWETQTRAETSKFLPSPSPKAAQAAPPETPASGMQPGTSGGNGAAIFAAKCNACHPDGKAGVGPPVRGDAFMAKYPDDAALKQLIRSGRGGMPAYPVAALAESDLDTLVAYLRTLK